VGVLAFGPNKAGAELENSKAFMKDILHKYAVVIKTPIPDYSIEPILNKYAVVIETPSPRSLNRY
jgi:phosphoribosylamine-glycine ligase